MDAISAGRLRPGDRLPTQRELATRLGLAVGTVMRAYVEAERRGLTYGAGRRGTFVGPRTGAAAPAPGREPPPTPQVDLSRYFPATQEDPDLARALRHLADHPRSQTLLQYPAAGGDPRHLLAGSRWIASLGLDVQPDSLMIAAGAQHALFVVLLAMGQRGDVICADSHTYPGIRTAAGALGLLVVGVEGDQDGMLPDALEAACRRRTVRFVYVNPTLQNPTNVTVPTARRRQLASIADRHGVWILEDAINRRLHPSPPALFTELVPHRSFLLASVSKVLAGTLRVCFLLAPPETRSRIASAIQASALLISPLTAELAATWILDGAADAVVERRRASSRARQELAIDALAGLTMVSHPCSYFLWLTLPDAWAPERLAAETQRQGVIISPASVFALDRRAAHNAVRICLGGTVEPDRLRSALRIVARILKGPEIPPAAAV